MAQTIKEFAVKLSVDTSSITQSTSKLNKALTQTRDLFKSIFGNTSGIERVGNAINQTLTEEMEKLNQKFRDQAQVREEMMRKELKGVQKGTREETKLRNQAIKDIEGRRREFNKRMAQAERQRIKESVKAVRDAQKAFQQASGQFKTDIISIETDQPIKDIQSLGRALQSTQADITERTNRQLRNLDSQREEDIKMGEKNLLQIVKDGERRQAQALKAAARQRINSADGNAERIEQIERELQDGLLRIEREGTARRSAIRRTAAQRREDAPRERRTGRIGRGGAIISEGARDVAGSATAQFGALGGVLTKLGPAGLIAGGAIAGLVGVFGSASKANAEFTDGIAKIKTLMTDEQAMNLDVPLAQLRTTATSTGQEINGLQDAMFNVISATPSLTSNLSAASNIVDKAAKTAVGLGASTDEVAQAASNLGNALGLPLEKAENVDTIMDILSNTMKQGVIPNASILAKNVSKVAPLMGFLFENTNEAAKSIGALTASMTANGVSVEESQTKIKALFLELGDPKKQAQLFKKGIEGINQETGKIEDIRKVFESMGKDVKGFDQIFTSSEAKDALKIFTKEGGAAISGMMDTFDNAGGTADFMFKTMAETGKNASERISATMNDLKISIGGGVNEIAQDAKGLIADSLSFVADLFKSEEQVFLESQAKLDKASQNVKVFNDLIKSTGDEIANIDSLIASGQSDEAAAAIAQEIKNIGNAANQFKDDFPFIAENIQKIINAPGEKTLRTVMLLNEQIEKAQGLAQSEQLVTSFAASEAAIGALGERLDEIRDNVVGGFAGGTDFFSKFLGVDEGVTQAFGTDILAQVKTVGTAINAEIENLKAERDAAQAEGTNEGAERALEIGEELRQLYKDRREAGVAELEIRSSVEQSLDRELGIARDLAVANKETFDIQEEVKLAREAVAGTLGLEGESLALINQLGNEKIATELAVAGKTEELIAFKEHEKDVEIALLANKRARLDLSTEEGQAQKEKMTAQIAELQIQRDGISAQEEKNALIDEEAENVERIAKIDKKRADNFRKLVDSNREVTDEKISQTKITSELNALILDRLGTEKMSTEERIKGLEAIAIENDEQQKILKTEIQQARTQIAQIRNLNLIAQLSGAVEKGQADILAGLEDQLQVLENQAKVLAAAGTGLTGKIDKLKSGQTAESAFGRFGKSGSGKDVEKPVEKEREKFEVERLKNDKEREKERQTMAEKAKNAQKEAQDKAKKAAEDREKKRKERAEKIQKAREEAARLAGEQLKREAVTANRKQDNEQKLIKNLLATQAKLTKQFDDQGKKSLDGIASTVKQFSTLADEINNARATVKRGTTDFVAALETSIDDAIKKAGDIQLINKKETKTALAEVKGLRLLMKQSITAQDRDAQILIGLAIRKEAGKSKERGTDFGILGINRALEAVLLEFKGANFRPAVINTVQKVQDKIGKVADNLFTDFNVALDKVNLISKSLGKAQVEGLEGLRKLATEERASTVTKAKSIKRGAQTEASLGIEGISAVSQLEEIAKAFSVANKKFSSLSAQLESANTPEEIEKAALAYERVLEDLESGGVSLDELLIEFGKVSGSQIIKDLKAAGKLTEEQLTLLNGRLGLLKTTFEINKLNIETQKENSKSRKDLLELEKQMSEPLATQNALMAKIKKDIEDSIDPSQRIRDEWTSTSEKLNLLAGQLRKQREDQLKILDNLREQKVETAKQIADNEILIAQKRDIDSTDPKVLKEIEGLVLANRELADLQTDTNEKLKENTQDLADNTQATQDNNQAKAKGAELTQDELDAKDIEGAQKSVDDLDSSNLINFASGIGDAVKGIKKLKELKQFGSAMEGTAKAIAGVATAIDGAAQLTEDSIVSMIDITEKFKEGDAGGATQGIGDITKKIGGILLNSKIQPLQIAGAVMLVAGTITGIVGKIISALGGIDKDSKQIAQEKSDILDQQVSAYEAQLAIVTRLNELEDNSVDTAKERLAMLKKANAELIESNEQAAEFAGWTDAQLISAEKNDKIRVSEIENGLKLLENAENLSDKAQERLVKELGFDMGVNVTKKEIARVKNALEAEKIDIESDLSAIDFTLGFRGESLQLMREIINEEVSSIDFVIQGNVATGDILDALDLVKQRTQALKPLAENAFLAAGIDVDLTGKTKEQVEALIETLDRATFPPDAITDINAFLEALTKSSQVIEDTFQTQIDLIRARQSAEKITQEEADEQVIILLEEQLALLIEQGAAEILILGIEAEILGIKNAQTEEDEAQNEALSEAVRKRQELLNIIRQESQGGTLTNEQRGQLAESERTIVGELRASGASEEEIQSFISTLPAFSGGGVAQKTGLALVTKGEPIIPINRLKEIDEQFRMMGELFATTNPIVSGDNELTRQISTIILQKEAQAISKSINITIGDIVNNIDVGSGNATEIIQKIQGMSAENILNIVQKGLDQDKIDLREKIT